MPGKMTRAKQLALSGYHGFDAADEARPINLESGALGYTGVGLDGEAEQADVPTVADLEAMTKAELAALAEQYDLDVEPSGDRRAPLKGDYVEALAAALGS